MNYQEERKQKAETTRRDILDAAADLARERGFEQMSVRDVCARAGVTTGAFYHHFSSKEELVTQGFTTLDDYLEKEMADCRFSDPLRRLEFLLRSFAGYTEKMGWQNMALYYQRRFSAQSSAAASPHRFTLRTMVECFEELSEEGVLSPAYTPKWAADLCFRHFRGVVIDWILHRGGYRLWDKLEQDYTLLHQALQM